MKRNTFVSIVLTLGLLFGGWRVCAASGSETPGAPFEIQTRQEVIDHISCLDRMPDYLCSWCQSAPVRELLLLADRTEKEDRIILGTDPEMERAMDDQIKQEQEKEDKAWKMLENMNIYKDNQKGRNSTPQDKVPRPQSGGS